MPIIVVSLKFNLILNNHVLIQFVCKVIKISSFFYTRLLFKNGSDCANSIRIIIIFILYELNSSSIDVYICIKVCFRRRRPLSRHQVCWQREFKSTESSSCGTLVMKSFKEDIRLFWNFALAQLLDLHIFTIQYSTGVAHHII